MKTAFLFSGHMRSFPQCLPAIAHHLVRPFAALGDVGFFVATVADHNAVSANLLKERFPKSFTAIKAVLEQPDCIAELRAAGCPLPENWQRGRPYMHEPFPISVHPQAVARQLWQLREVWRLFSAAEDAASYDVFVRVRPDLWFHSFAFPGELHSPAYIPPDARPEIFAPWWGRFGGINDRLAVIGSHAAAEAYFSTYTKIPEFLAAGVPLHPESLLAAAVQCFHVRSELMSEFSTLRENGESRPPEILTQDLAALCARR